MEQQLCSKMNAVEFWACIVALMRKARLPDTLRKDALVIIDEYTVIQKPLLLTLLVLLKHLRIGTIICGDEKQLQTIHDSAHTTTSSFGIAKFFADEVFYLDKIVRCADEEYNKMIAFMSELSSDKPVGNLGYSLVATLFYKQIFQNSSPFDTHIAMSHRELANSQHMHTVGGRHPVSFYYVHLSNPGMLATSACVGSFPNNMWNRGLYMTYTHWLYENNLREQKRCVVGKFLPYLPLVIGGRYFVSKFSEYSQGTLVRIIYHDEKVNLLDESNISKIVVKMDVDGSECEFSRVMCKDVVFEEHRKYLLNNFPRDNNNPRRVIGSGGLYNFPIYPSNYMSVHMCQGRTVVDNIDLILNQNDVDKKQRLTYQALYVAVSRVKKPSQFTRVVMPNSYSYLLSAILNFPELCDVAGDEMLKFDVIRKRMSNFILYYFPYNPESALLKLMWDFVHASQRDERRYFYEAIKNFVSDPVNKRIVSVIEIINCDKRTSAVEGIDENYKVLNFILNTHPLTFVVANVDNVNDACLWMHAFSKRYLKLNLLIDDKITLSRTTLLGKYAQLEEMLRGDENVDNYIFSKCKQKMKSKSRDEHQHYIATYSDGTVLECTKLQKFMHKNSVPIEVPDLMIRLQEIIDDEAVQRTKHVAKKRKL